MGHIVFNIAQEVDLSDESRAVKSFYVNMGRSQGVREGVILNVFRVISRVNPYKTKKYYNFKIKIGELKVLHAESDSSMAILHLQTKNRNPLHVEVDGIMIGDQIAVKVRE